MLDKVDSATFNNDPNRYSLVPGNSKGAPLCPYGNHYQWIGYDTKANKFVRFTKSVFNKLFINKERGH